MAATETPLVDAGECGWCRHGQWSHKLGKRGCKDPDCGCAKYEPPKDAPAAPADPEPTRAELVSDLTAQSIELGTYDLVVPADGEPTCAYPDGGDNGEHDHALCEDVVAEQAELAAVEVDPAETPGTPKHTREVFRAHAQLRLDRALEAMQPYYDDVLPTIEEAFSWRDQLAAADDLEQRLVGQLNEAHQAIGRARSALLTAGVPFEVTDEVGLAGAIDRYAADVAQAMRVMGAESKRLRAAELEEERLRFAGRLDTLGIQLAGATRERDEAVVQRDQAYERVEEQDVELGQVRTALDVDVDADLVVAAERLRDEATAANADAAGRRDEVARLKVAAEERVNGLSTDLTGLHAALTRADGEVKEAQRRAQALAAELDSERARAARLERQLASAKAGRQHAQQTLSEAIQAGTEAAAKVLWRYDAEQCQECGSRYTKPTDDHPHPLEPVTVLIVRREVAG